MSGYLADTSIFIAAEQGRPLGNPPTGEARISVVTVSELLLGVHRAHGTQLRQVREETLARARAFVALAYDEPSAEYFAGLVAGLRQGKRRALVMDAIIAATALAHDLAIWSADDDFRALAEIEPRLRIAPA
ncbi:MAG: PIN domain-containing protein [Solirubrobacterales bacterium]